LATIRVQAPEIVQTARTQRWLVEEILRTLVAAEITAPDQTNQQLRLKAVTFPVLKRLDAFDAAASSIPMPTYNYVASLEWVNAKENLLVVGPAGTGKSHLLLARGHHQHVLRCEPLRRLPVPGRGGSDSSRAPQIARARDLRVALPRLMTREFYPQSPRSDLPAKRSDRRWQRAHSALA
jgi:hypothetical protein